MLDSGTGAVLVSFPAPDFFRRDDWMCQANLTGSIDTRMLPRLPFADLQSVLILDVPPGKYSAVAFAWQRGSDPQWGGSSDSVVVQSGRLTTLRARRFSGDPYPYNHTPLDLAEISLWKLPRQEDIHKYVASVLRETAKG